MKSNRLLIIVSTLGLALLSGPLAVSAESGFSTSGDVTIEASGRTDPLDPENPLTPVDPGESPSTQGDLRIDFVSAINFAKAEITPTNRNYPSLAQLFYSDTPARGSYVQVTDLRQGTPGWSLQLKQTAQFQNGDSIELNGARLSFDKGWANSGGTGTAPAVFRDTISIDEIGSSYQVASAAKGAGNGTWMLSFGASSANANNQETSLIALKDKDGQPMVDSVYQKEMYSNTAITLSVPDKTTILAGDYQTELIWILQATP